MPLSDREGKTCSCSFFQAVITGQRYKFAVRHSMKPCELSSYAWATHTIPSGAKKIMLLRRMQVAIPIADQSKPFSMSVLRKEPLSQPPRIARSWDALSGFGQRP